MEISKQAYDSLIDKMRLTDVVVLTIMSNNDDPPAPLVFEIGVAAVLDKQVIALVAPGVPISAKLAKLIDRFIEVDFSDPQKVADQLRDSVLEFVTDAEATKRDGPPQVTRAEMLELVEEWFLQQSCGLDVLASHALDLLREKITSVYP